MTIYTIEGSITNLDGEIFNVAESSSSAEAAKKSKAYYTDPRQFKAYKLQIRADLEDGRKPIIVKYEKAPDPMRDRYDDLKAMPLCDCTDRDLAEFQLLRIWFA